ncbi:MAG: DUF3857 domain-containing protein [Planctomycetes bacterium]|nr:DUF3857 domain-containing protein [Planctomycetota bacterium]
MKAKTFANAGITLSIYLGLAITAAPAGPPRPASPEEIAGMIAAAGDAKDYSNAAVVYVLDEADVYVKKSGLATTESCQVFKILTDAGVRSNSVYRRQFDPATNNITVKSIRIHRQDGTIQDVDVSGMVTQPARQGIIFWGNQQYALSLPRLAIGDAVELRVSRTGYNVAYLASSDGTGETVLSASGKPLRPPMPGHWYDTVQFQAGHPILKKRYSVHMPKDMPLQYEVYNGSLQSSLWFDRDHNVYTWTAEDLPAFKGEPHMVARSDCATKVVMATVGSWEAKSRWFYEANESQFQPNDEIRAKVEELTAGLPDEEAKIAALNSWVADNCRYVGTTRGQHEGFTLHKSLETFRDRGGVCKDKAGMLVTMLRVLGHEAFAAMTMAGSRVEQIPADQFNHSVTVMRNADGTFRLLDPTWAPLSRETWSSREALQGIVYGTPEGQDLALSPYFAPDQNTLTCRSRGEITADGTLKTSIHMAMKGYPCTYLRRELAPHTPSGRQSVVRDALRIAPNALIEQLTFTDPYDYSSDSRLDTMIQAEDYVAGDRHVRMFHLPLLAHPLSSFLFPDAFYSVDAKERQFGFRLRATRLIRYKETLRLPDGWSVESVPDPVDLDSPAAALSFEAHAEGGFLTYEFELTLKKHIIPPEDYAEFKKTLDSMKQLSKEWIVCTVDRSATTHADVR